MHERLRRVCFIDYDREIALVVDLKNRDGKHQILGVGRLIKEHGTDEAEFAVLISDPWQGKGFGSELLKLLVQIGRKEAFAPNHRPYFSRKHHDETASAKKSASACVSTKPKREWKAELVL